MNAGMQVLNLATRPHPATAPTPPAQADYGPAIGERRLVCEQWNGNQWVRLAVPASSACNEKISSVCQVRRDA